MTRRQQDEIALLCNPLAGGRWRALADVLDSEEARGAHRIVTDEIDDIRAAIAGLGRRVELLCIYGGDGTIFRVLNELLREPEAPVPRLALLGGGTMNVTAEWCGMTGSPGERFRELMRRHRADRLLWREVPLLAVTQNQRTQVGFTFGIGPLVRILARYEAGRKSRLHALRIGASAALAAVAGVPRDLVPILRELEAELTVDGERLPHQRYSAVLANVTGVINPFVAPFAGERTRETFHFLGYAVSSREIVMMLPLLARGFVPIDARALLHPISTWRKAVLALVGRSGLPPDPRFVNRPIHELVVDTDEPRFTIDGEVLASVDRRFTVRLGPTVQLATLRG